MAETVAFIGLGTMGRPMALNIAKGGFALRIFDIVPSAMEAFMAAGATATASPRDAAALPTTSTGRAASRRIALPSTKRSRRH